MIAIATRVLPVPVAITMSAFRFPLWKCSTTRFAHSIPFERSTIVVSTSIAPTGFPLEIWNRSRSRSALA